MLKKIKKKLLSLMLVLSLLIINVVHADDVYISAIPTNNVTTTSVIAGSPIVVGGTTTSAVSTVKAATANSSGQIYPGSLGKTDDSPTSVSITSPGANNKKIKSTTTNTTSNVISNGVTWETDTTNIAPVSVEITSPADHQNKLKNSTTSAINNDVTTNTPTNGFTISSDANNASTQNNTTTNVSVSSGTYQMKNTGLANPVISSDGALVLNGTNGDIYYAKNPAKAYAPAGLNALLVGYILLQHKSLDDVMAVSQTAVSNLESGANNAGLKAGDVITVKDALYALYIKSCCDVAKVIAENVAGSEAAFVNLMNQTAASIGCTATAFYNCTGLNNSAQVTTVLDIAIIMNLVTNNATLNQIMQTPSYTLPATAHRKAMTITTKNELLNPSKSNYYAGIICSRMGYTSKAKYTMASFVLHNNQKIIAVCMYSNGSQFVDTKRMLNFGKVVVDTLKLTQGGSVTTQNFATTQTTSATQVYTTQTQTTQSSDTQGTWTQDQQGWYFTKANGSKAVNEWIITSGKRYCVDANGYMITGWREFSNGNIYYFDPTSGVLKSNTWVNMSTGAYYLQQDGSLARASKGQTKTISTQVGNYVIDENGKAISKAN